MTYTGNTNIDSVSFKNIRANIEDKGTDIPSWRHRRAAVELIRFKKEHGIDTLVLRD